MNESEKDKRERERENKRANERNYDDKIEILCVTR